MEKDNQILRNSTTNTKITLSTKTSSLAERAKYGVIQAANNTAELVHSPAMRSVIRQRENGLEQCKGAIGMALGKAALALKIEMSDERIALIVEDMIEEFEYDPIDMILMVLKKGRKGKYRDIQKTYRDLNLEVISAWMEHERILLMEEKARENERQADQDYNELIRAIPQEQAEKLVKAVTSEHRNKEIEKPSTQKSATEEKYLEFLRQELPSMKREQIEQVRKNAMKLNAYGEVTNKEVLELIKEHL